jgi:hypothetical protein
MSDEVNLGVRPEMSVPEGEKYTSVMVMHLKKTRPWVLFMAILSIVASSLMALGGLLTIIGGTCFGSLMKNYSSNIMGPSLGLLYGLLGFIYLALATVYIPLIVYLFRYAGSIKKLVSGGKTVDLENALGHQYSYWKFVGIMAIVGMGIAFVVGIIVVIVIIFTVLNRMY